MLSPMGNIAILPLAFIQIGAFALFAKIYPKSFARRLLLGLITFFVSGITIYTQFKIYTSIAGARPDDVWKCILTIQNIASVALGYGFLLQHSRQGRR